MHLSFTPLRLLWAAPCSALGLLLALVPLAAGGRWAWRDGALEVCYRSSLAECGPRTRALRFRGIVFGHVILAVTEEELRQIGPHERVHVAQYGRWGALFLPAYALAGAWQWLGGRDAYWDNPFEVEARRVGDDVE